MRNKFLVLVCALLGSSCYAQTLVSGGFASCVLSTAEANSANAGGAYTITESNSKCLNVIGALVFGQSELFNAIGEFTDNCVQEDINYAIKVYPNPGMGVYNIECPNIQEIEVYDQAGRVVLQNAYPQSDALLNSFDITPFANGNYFVKIQNTQGRVWVYPLIKINP